MQQSAGIEHYLLYGEPEQVAELGFMHVERIALRSGAHDWTIQPHAHVGLHQILLLITGGGTMRVEADIHHCEAPALLVVPADFVHAFAFSPDTDGYVVTVAANLVSEATRQDPDITALLQFPGCFDRLGGELASHELPGAFEALLREFVWAAPARMPAIEAHLIRVLVGSARLDIARRPDRQRLRQNPDTVLVDRFRQLIEQEFRNGLSLADYVKRLNVTESRLSAACHKTLGQSAIKLVHRRLMLEAQRCLLYTTLTVAEIAFSLGFQDPAYFSRFFSKRAGQSPGSFRAERASARDGVTIGEIVPG